jgi:5-methylthioadenosine/S-adenosylhomocysteine deaminase
MRVLIRGAALLALDDPEPVREGIDLLVEDGRIADVGPRVGAASTPDRVVEARDRLVMPGLVNAHVHSHNNYFRGAFENLPLDLCVLQVWGIGARPEARRLTPRQVYARALLGCAEMLRTGTTTAVDDVNLNPCLTEEHVAAVVQAYEDSGMRAVVAPHVFDVPYHQSVPFLGDSLPAPLREALEGGARADVPALAGFMRACARRWGGSGRRVRFGIGPSGPQRCSDALLLAMAEVAEECDLPLYIHLLETRTQAAMGPTVYGKTLVARLRDLGVLGPRVSLGHAVWVTPGDVQMLADARVTVCHLPVSNLRLGSGIAPVPRMLRAGVPVALGTDGVIGNDGMNMFEAIKFAALLHKVREPEPERWLGARDALRMATAGSSRSARLEGTGAIAVGQPADLVLLDLRRASFAPRNNLLHQVVYAENGSSVDMVMADGRIVVEGGRVLTVDEAAVADEVTRDAAAFHARNATAWPHAGELDARFRQMYARCWQTDVGVEAFGPRP